MPDGKFLGIAIRARWLGFAELDSQRCLLDWGMMFYQRRSPTELKSARKRLEGLLARMNPSAIVLVLPDARTNEVMPAVRSITRALHAAVSSRSILVVTLLRTVIRDAFAPCDARTKREIALCLARMFPEIAWKLPPERKIWEKEDSRMALFDALGGAVAYHKHQFGNGGCGKRSESIESSGRPHGDV